MRLISFRMMVIFLGLFFVKLANADINFNYDNARSYINSIQRIREALSHALPNVPGVRVTDQNAGQAITRINFTHSSGRTIGLILLNQNLYAVGFVSGGIFHRFNDPEFSNITVADTTVSNLRMASSYSSLERVAADTGQSRYDRSTVRVGQPEFENAVYNLNRYGDGSVTPREVARAMLVLATAVPEAARFADLSRAINSRWGNFVLGNYFVNLTTNWSRISEYASIMSDEAGSTADFYSTITNARNRNNLYGILAVALYCRLPRLGALDTVVFDESALSDSCPARSGLALINNRYWGIPTLVTLLN